MQRPDRGRPVPEEGQGNATRLALGEGERRTGGHRDAAADDRTRAKHSSLDAAQVHRATATACEAVPQPEDLGQGLQDRLLDQRGCGLWSRRCEGTRIVGGAGDHARKHVVMGAVRGGNLVLTLQGRHRTDRDGLLADAGMQGAVHQRFVVH